ncbi:MAG: YdcF family protein [Chloroflexi bacterium]|nr:YdcF family protein [Chloroflexota bacterium]
MKRTLRRRILAAVIVLAAALPIAARSWTALAARDDVYRTASATPPQHVAIIFGAGVRNGYPTAMLYDRVAAGVELYRAGRVQQLLMSGDDRGDQYNEPAAMRRTALQLGVPDSEILLDPAGRSTYDTCRRASADFGLRSAVLVTQDFHLDRALMLCRSMGIDAVGFSADRRPYRSIWWNQFREIPATLNAMIELWVTKPGRG